MAVFKPVRFGKYLLFNKIATGGMAELYRAKSTGVQGFEKLVAIKTILPHLTVEEILITSFIDEAKIAALLQHPNIVQIYDFGKIEGTYFIAMEYLLGKDLKFLLKKAKETKLPLSPEHALFIASRICAGLEYAHKLKDFYGKPLNIIHRDISPQNIFITYDGQVKIIDFGIAKTAMQNTTTQSGSIKGKMAYMSPEQALGETIDLRTDLFAIGNILYEMTTGKMLFEGTGFHVYAKVREADFEHPETVNSSLPASLYAILDQALTKNPADRYQYAGQMQADLEKCISELSYRPNDCTLSKYMNKLFKGETAQEAFIHGEAFQSDYQTEQNTDNTNDQQSSYHPTLITNKKNPQQYWKLKINIPGIFAIALIILGLIAIFVITNQSDPKSDNINHTQLTLSSVEDSAVKPLKSPNIIKNKSDSINNHLFFEISDKANDEVLETALKKCKALLDKKRFKDAAALLKDLNARNMHSEDNTLEWEVHKLVESPLEKVKAQLIRFLHFHKQNDFGYYLLGWIFYELKDERKAIDSYEKAMELESLRPEVPYNLGIIYARRKENLTAETLFKQAVKLRPDFFDALCNLAVVQEQLGKLSESMENIQKAIQVNSGNTQVKKYLAKLKNKIKQKKMVD